jgi:hypothetical protein
MKIPVKAPCYACQEKVTVFMTLPDREISFRCSRGHDNAGPVESEVGSLMLTRAEYEFTTNRDLTVTVILAAMAFEAELSRLHHKWRTIGALKRAHEISDEELEKLLRKHARIRDKINHVARLMHRPGLDNFVSTDVGLRRIVDEGYPSLHSGSLAQGFERALFWPRNRVVHMGKVIRERQDAVRGLNLARLGIYIFDRLDHLKRDSA